MVALIFSRTINNSTERYKKSAECRYANAEIMVNLIGKKFGWSLKPLWKAFVGSVPVQADHIRFNVILSQLNLVFAVCQGFLLAGQRRIKTRMKNPLSDFVCRST